MEITISKNVYHAIHIISSNAVEVVTNCYCLIDITYCYVCVCCILMMMCGGVVRIVAVCVWVDHCSSEVSLFIQLFCVFLLRVGERADTMRDSAAIVFDASKTIDSSGQCILNVNRTRTFDVLISTVVQLYNVSIMLLQVESIQWIKQFYSLVCMNIRESRSIESKNNSFFCFDIWCGQSEAKQLIKNIN